MENKTFGPRVTPKFELEVTAESPTEVLLDAGKAAQSVQPSENPEVVAVITKLESKIQQIIVSSL